MKLPLAITIVSLGLVHALPTKPENRIIGGSEAYEGQFPYQAAIYFVTGGQTFFCGGVLINSEWVLTAGFCVVNATRFTVHLGQTNIKFDDENSLKFITTEYVLHPQFNPKNLQHNLGLIKLQEQVFYTPFIQPVRALATSDTADGLTVLATGWGQTSDNSPSPVDRLNYVPLTTRSLSFCRQYYGSIITEQMLCVGGNRFQGTCYGDLGGPLILEQENGQYSLIGIASFISGTETCESPHPSGYTKIYYYRDWIVKTVNSM